MSPQGALILEENNLAEGLPSQLEAYGDLGHGGISHMGAPGINLALAMGTAYADAALADGREHRVAIALRKKRGALPRVLKGIDGIAIAVSPGHRAGQGQEKQDRKG